MISIALPLDELPVAKQSGYKEDTFGQPRLVGPDGDVMEVVVHAYVCTIFFNGLPVVVIPPSGDYKYNFVEYLFPPEIKHFVTFMTEIVGEFGVTGKSNREAARMIRNAVDAGMVRSYWDEYGGQGQEIAAFGAVVVRAIRHIFPDMPDPKRG